MPLHPSPCGPRCSPGPTSSSSPATCAAALLAASGHSALPPPLVRPPGHLALLGPRDGALWLLHASGQPMALPLSSAHAGARAFALAAAGDTAGAVQVKGVPPALLAGRACFHPQEHIALAMSTQLACREVAARAHDALASLLVCVEGARGAQCALQLTGLTLRTEARLRLLLRQWPQVGLGLGQGARARRDRKEAEPGREEGKPGILWRACAGNGGS